MIDAALSLIAPHLCSGCGKIGSLLCANCKYNIISEPYGCCIACGRLAPPSTGICGRCRVPYKRAWCVGERSDELQRLIGNFKFSRTLSAYKTLAGLIDETLPQLPENTVIIPVPTVRSHIRERGYDHTLLIARDLAKRRNLCMQTNLQRVTTTRQRDASRRQRIAQAKSAFLAHGALDPLVPYLLVDDVVTTGATIKYAAKALQAAGATEIWVASVSRQPQQN